ncbi:MAG: hypothetical protein J5809_01205 [Selenomonadaceae bacterium]|nr:hypothetical protein [Selenomonadaceae bacterium]
MNGIRKIFGVMFLLACLILPQSVSAEKSDWKDSSYNFRGIRSIVLTDVESRVDRGSNLFYQKLQSTYVDNARKRLKCEVLTEEQARRISGNSRNFADVADLYIECNIKDWSDDYYIVPERTVWEKKKMHRKVRDRYGYWEDEEYETTVPVTYPPYRVDVSKIAVSFEVYDTRTGRMVFGREDVRDRNDANAQDGMYGRICNSFFQDFAKVIK